jgi:RNA recognition motif-containing protein
MIQPVLGKGFCFVEMINHESAAAAVKSASLNPLQLRDKTLSVGWAKSWHDSSNKNRNYGYQRIPLLKEAPSPDAKTLFIRYLGPTVNEADIRLLFADYDVHSVTKPAGKNYAFVEFIDSTAASKAMDGVGAGEAESVMLKGASVAIGWARSQGTYSSRKNENCWFCLGSSTVKVTSYSCI